MQEPEQAQRRTGRREVGGLLAGRTFVPWSTVALALVMTMGLAGVLLTGGAADPDGPALQINAAASDDIGAEIPAEPVAEDSSTTTSVHEAPQTGGATSSTTSTTKAKPATTSTTLKNGVSTTLTTLPATSTTVTVDTAPKNPVVVLTDDSWAAVPAGVRRVVFATADRKAYPGLKVWFNYRVKGGTRQFIATFGEPRTTPDSPPFTHAEQALYEFPSHELDVITGGGFEDYFQGIVGWEWDGGEITPDAPVVPAITLSLVRVDRCAAGENCLGYRFESDRPMTNLKVFYRVKQGSGASDPTPNREVRFDSGKTMQTIYYGPSQLAYSDGDAFPGLDTVIGVSWLGGSYDGSRVRVCTTSNPC